MGRPKSGYDWESRKDALYDLYITQNKSMDEVLALQPDASTLPSKRAFQKRFKEWGFPSKHQPAPSDAALFERIRALWETNTTHKQMIAVLNSEGFDINERQLAKIRQKNQLWIRENRQSSNAAPVDGDEEGDDAAQQDPVAGDKRPRDTVEPVPAEIVAKRRETHAKLLAESDERLKSRTRRRRTRGWAGLPPDEGLDPRFPSELTLAEAITDLNLERDLYREVRRQFEQICQTENLVKKTICGPERWSEAKNTLISRFEPLQAIFWQSDPAILGQTRKPMALDVICMDVTKRLRTSGNHITIAEAKNTLGLTPHEAREVRASFDAILKANFFTGKLESTKERWEDLKSEWIQSSTRLRVALSIGDADPAYASKVRAVEAIARDVQKRNRDNQTRFLFPRDGASVSRPQPPKDMRPVAVHFPRRPGMEPWKSKTPQQPKQSTQPSPGKKYEASRKAGQDLIDQSNTFAEFEESATSPNPIATLASQALASAPDRDYSGMQIDPSLLEAALPNHQQQLDNGHDIIAQLQQAILPEQATKSVYLRLSQTSTQHFPSTPKILLESIPVDSYSVAYLKELALKKSKLEGIASVQRIAGVATGDGAERWPIDEDDELEAYLSMVGDGKATFVVDLVEAI